VRLVLVLFLEDREQLEQGVVKLLHRALADGSGEIPLVIDEPLEALGHAEVTAGSREPDELCPPIARIGDALEASHLFELGHQLTDGLLADPHALGELGQTRAFEIDVGKQGGVRGADRQARLGAHLGQHALVEQTRGSKEQLRHTLALPFRKLVDARDSKVLLTISSTMVDYLTVRAIAEGVWEAEHDLYVSGFMHFRGRMVVLRLDDGSLMLHSPIPLPDDLAELGPVSHIVAPNTLHHLHFREAAERFPDATTWAAPGLAKKRKDLSFAHELGGDGPWPEEVDCVVLEGMPAVNEALFFHRASRTLVLTDLVFNIHEVNNWITRVVLKMVGAWQRCASSRLLRSTVKDRVAFSRSLQRALQWDFARVVVAHGRNIEDDARDTLQQALAWTS
jgi:hypothetical protein